MGSCAGAPYDKLSHVGGGALNKHQNDPRPRISALSVPSVSVLCSAAAAAATRHEEDTTRQGEGARPVGEGSGVPG